MRHRKRKYRADRVQSINNFDVIKTDKGNELPSDYQGTSLVCKPETFLEKIKQFGRTVESVAGFPTTAEAQRYLDHIEDRNNPHKQTLKTLELDIIARPAVRFDSLLWKIPGQFRFRVLPYGNFYAIPLKQLEYTIYEHESPNNRKSFTVLAEEIPSDNVITPPTEVQNWLEVQCVYCIVVTYVAIDDESCSSYNPSTGEDIQKFQPINPLSLPVPILISEDLIPNSTVESSAEITLKFDPESRPMSAMIGGANPDETTCYIGIVVYTQHTNSTMIEHHRQYYGFSAAEMSLPDFAKCIRISQLKDNGTYYIRLAIWGANPENELPAGVYRWYSDYIPITIETTDRGLSIIKSEAATRDIVGFVPGNGINYVVANMTDGSIGITVVTDSGIPLQARQLWSNDSKLHATSAIKVTSTHGITCILIGGCCANRPAVMPVILTEDDALIAPYAGNIMFVPVKEGVSVYGEVTCLSEHPDTLGGVPCYGGICCGGTYSEDGYPAGVTAEELTANNSRGFVGIIPTDYIFNSNNVEKPRILNFGELASMVTAIGIGTRAEDNRPIISVGGCFPAQNSGLGFVGYILSESFDPNYPVGNAHTLIVNLRHDAGIRPSLDYGTIGVEILEPSRSVGESPFYVISDIYNMRHISPRGGYLCFCWNYNVNMYERTHVKTGHVFGRPTWVYGQEADDDLLVFAWQTTQKQTAVQFHTRNATEKRLAFQLNNIGTGSKIFAKHVLINGTPGYMVVYKAVGEGNLGVLTIEAVGPWDTAPVPGFPEPPIKPDKNTPMWTSDSSPSVKDMFSTVTLPELPSVPLTLVVDQDCEFKNIPNLKIVSAAIGQYYEL